MTKIIGQTYNGEEFNLNLEPEVIEIPQFLVEEYEQNSLSKTDPKNRAWVSINNKYYAVGYLAQSRFKANAGLSLLKRERAIYKVLATLWIIKEKYQLPSSLKVALACLLPPGEYADKVKFYQELTTALTEFITPTGVMKVKLTNFNCKPEGAGIFMMHRFKRGQIINQVVTAMIMIGYRNASIMISRRGAVGEFKTSDLGFIQIIKSLLQKTSGYREETLVVAIAKSGYKLADQPLQKILRSREQKSQQEELSHLKNTICNVVNQEYVNTLYHWFQEVIPPEVDEIVYGGGTSHFLRWYLTQHFQPKQQFFHAEVEIPDELDPDQLEERLVDVFCLYLYLIQQLSGHYQDLKSKFMIHNDYES